MKKSIVIAHYNEDLEWLKNIKDTKIYLYTKGNSDINPAENIIIEILDNIGNEQHTYLYHIVNHYKKLDDVIFFTQANPFEHCHDFFKKLENNYIGGLSDFNLITTIYGEVDRSIYKKHINHKYSNIGTDSILGNVFIDPWNDHNAINNLEFLISELHELGIKRENWIFNANGMYSATKEKLNTFNLDFYSKCLDTFKTPDTRLNMLAFAFERLSKFIYL